MLHSRLRGRVMDCGRRSGKSELAKRILVLRLRDKIPGCRKPRYICAAPTQEQAVEIFWEDLLELIPEKWIAGGKKGPNVSYSRFRIKLRNGASVRVVGLDKPHRIEGKYCNGFVGDEWSDVKDGVFVIKIAENVKVEVARGAVTKVLEKDEKPETGDSK